MKLEHAKTQIIYLFRATSTKHAISIHQIKEEASLIVYLLYIVLRNLTIFFGKEKRGIH